MTKIPADGRRITYKNAVMRNGTWKANRAGKNLDEALVQAKSALATGRFDRVRVEQLFTDPFANRTVITTVFEQAGTPAVGRELNAWMWLGGAVLLGIRAFF